MSKIGKEDIESEDGAVFVLMINNIIPRDNVMYHLYSLRFPKVFSIQKVAHSINIYRYNVCKTEEEREKFTTQIMNLVASKRNIAIIKESIRLRNIQREIDHS